MQSSTNLKVRTHYEPSELELSDSLWRSPSSPPYIQTHSSNQKSAGNSRASSPSTPSEFEFDSIRSLEIRDDPPASPKLISSFTTEYWSTAYSFGSACTTGGAEVSPFGAGRTTTTSPAEVSSFGAGRTITSTKQPSTPPSPSVRQLMEEEMLGEHDDGDGLALDFYSAPQTPTPPRKSSRQRPWSQDHEPTFNIAAHGGQRKSKSVVLERRAPFELALPAAAQKSQLLQSSRSEPHGYFMSSSSSSSTSPLACPEERDEEDKGGAKKQGGSKSFKKWAFKDILRRTVPSSKAEAHYRTRVVGATSSRNYLLSTSRGRSTPTMSPTAISHIHQSHINSTSISTLQAARPPSTPPAQSRTSTTARTPAPSPLRSPMSPHAAHYERRKAQSQDLSRKTFLPYRQISLLGCLGGPGAFPPEQHVW